MVKKLFTTCPHTKSYVDATMSGQEEKEIKNLASMMKKWFEANKDSNYKWKITVTGGGLSFIFELSPADNKNECVKVEFYDFEEDGSCRMDYSYKNAKYAGKDTTGWQILKF